MNYFVLTLIAISSSSSSVRPPPLRLVNCVLFDCVFTVYVNWSVLALSVYKTMTLCCRFFRLFDDKAQITGIELCFSVCVQFQCHVGMGLPIRIVGIFCEVQKQYMKLMYYS